tara:strand:+ start:369 stop:590 length:222 start_codon:yes stop_codon:yes gene_type:complete
VGETEEGVAVRSAEEDEEEVMLEAAGTAAAVTAGVGTEEVAPAAEYSEGFSVEIVGLASPVAVMRGKGGAAAV